MKRTSRLLLMGLAVGMSLLLVACSSTTPSSQTGEKPGGKTFLNIATSTSGGTFYAVGGKLADMITKNIPNAQATAEVTAGGVENARLLKNKKTDLATMPGDTLLNAVKGQGEFKEGKIDITQIASLYPTPLQIVALDKSGIKNVSDLKGKKVSIGAPGSSTAIRAEIVLNAHGLKLNDIKVDSTTSGEASTQLLDGQIDAAFFASGAPMAAILDVASKEKISLLPISDEAMAKIEKEHPDLFKLVVKAGTYPNQSKDTACIANMAILVCRPDLSEDLVYNITKMMFEQRSDFITAHKSLSVDFKLESAMSQEKITKYHPGALKYYKEKGLVK